MACELYICVCARQVRRCKISLHSVANKLTETKNILFFTKENSETHTKQMNICLRCERGAVG